MSENLRSELPNPNLYTFAEAEGNTAVQNVSLEVIESARPITVTQDHEAVAEEVAWAIKTDIDYAGALNEQRKAHDPLENAATVEIDGVTRITGVVPFEGQTKLNAANADIERNAKYGAQIAKVKHLGGAALELDNSRQKVANIKLR
jgi:hypothetical protein